MIKSLEMIGKTGNMDKIVAHWVERAEYDLETAKVMQEIFKWLYRNID
ncbi:MAG: hypothetical protein JRJ47_13835 [Deltaproteobacteria bacterium]|nr:hypothetical protein [Deltaproteobacteria bacterium]